MNRLFSPLFYFNKEKKVKFFNVEQIDENKTLNDINFEIIQYISEFLDLRSCFYLKHTSKKFSNINYNNFYLKNNENIDLTSLKEFTKRQNLKEKIHISTLFISKIKKNDDFEGIIFDEVIIDKNDVERILLYKVSKTKILKINRKINLSKKDLIKIFKNVKEKNIIYSIEKPLISKIKSEDNKITKENHKTIDKDFINDFEDIFENLDDRLKIIIENLYEYEMENVYKDFKHSYIMYKMWGDCYN